MNLDLCNQFGKKLIVKEKRKIDLIDIDKIIYLDCNSYITTLHILNGKKISTSKILKDFEYELTNYGFIRINRNTIVNPKYISEIETSFGKKIIKINNIKIKISRRKSYLFKIPYK